jgi:hypothetical protein
MSTFMDSEELTTVNHTALRRIEAHLVSCIYKDSDSPMPNPGETTGKWDELLSSLQNKAPEGRAVSRTKDFDQNHDAVRHRKSVGLS